MKASRLPWLLAVCAVFVLYREPSAAADITAELPAAVHRTLESVDPVLAPTGKAVETGMLQEFYQQRQCQPVWIDAAGLNARGKSLLSAFRDVGGDGLDPTDYDLGEAGVRPGFGVDQLAVAEVALSATLLRYAHDLRRGRAVLGKMDGGQRVTPKPVDPTQVLAGAAAAPDLQAYVQQLAPADPFYRGLRLALERYRAIAAAGAWPDVTDGPKLGPGAAGPRVQALRLRLQATGDLAADTPARSPDQFDDEVYQAVRRFQERHGLAPDGIIGPATRTALNVPVSARIRQIMLNLERARWLPEDLGDPYVLVNMASFELKVVEGGQQVLEMRVVVGERDKETPVFSDVISYIEVNPYWNVPRSIAVKEKLPQLRRNPSALSAQDIRVFGSGGEQINPASVDWSTVGANFPYRLRQDPGARNALGRIKFMFPNPYEVYMHDTPSRALFNRPVRAFSHGCIRVEKPMELAEFLLRSNTGWPTERIQRAIEVGKNRALTLVKPVPVHLVYLTAWVASDGNVQFRDDLYNRDARLVAALDAQRE